MSFRFVRTALVVLWAATAWHAGAQDFPNRSITMVMPYAPGGPGDTITRVFAGAMQKHLGQQIVVDNTAGASGAIGTAIVDMFNEWNILTGVAQCVSSHSESSP